MCHSLTPKHTKHTSDAISSRYDRKHDAGNAVFYAQLSALDEDAPLPCTTPANEIQEFYDSPNEIETDSEYIEALTESQYSDLQRLITSLEHASEEALRITSNPSLSERIDSAVGFAKLFTLE